MAASKPSKVFCVGSTRTSDAPGTCVAVTLGVHFKGLKGASRGLEKGFKGASERLQGGFRRASMGLQGEGGFKRA